MDAIQKRAGVPFSTSRKWEKAAKKRTIKLRRREDKEGDPVADAWSGKRHPSWEK